MRMLTPGKGPQQMTLKIGEQVGLQVPNRAPEGYLWAIDGDMPMQITLVDDGLVRDGPEPDPQSQPGPVPRIFVFEAKREGQAVVNLSERHSWDADGCPAQRAVIALTVRA